MIRYNKHGAISSDEQCAIRYGKNGAVRTVRIVGYNTYVNPTQLGMIQNG